MFPTLTGPRVSANPKPRAGWGVVGRAFLACPELGAWVSVTQCLCLRPHPRAGPDLDECRVRNLCQHTCQNTEGSYQCLCPAGYRLLPSGKNCQGEPPWGQAARPDAQGPGQGFMGRPFSTIPCEGGAGRQ